MSDTIILVLLIFIICREIVFWFATHKLLNKIMSRSYHDYQMAETVKKTVQKPDLAVNVIEDQEDMNVMRDFL